MVVHHQEIRIISRFARGRQLEIRLTKHEVPRITFLKGKGRKNTLVWMWDVEEVKVSNDRYGD